MKGTTRRTESVKMVPKMVPAVVLNYADYAKYARL